MWSAAPQVPVADWATVTGPQLTDASTTVTASARRARKVARISAVAIVVIFTGLAFTLRGKTDGGTGVFHPEDQVAMVLLGLVAAGGVLWFTRPRVVADRDGIRVRNLFGWMELPWDVVSAVRFDRGNPWASLELRDDDMISIMAIQAADKDYAVSTVRALRALLAAHRAGATG